MAEKLFTEFPPVTTEQWEAVIAKDLKGADYDKKLVWKTPEGFNVRPYYRAENLDNLQHLKCAPGEFPFVRGVCTDNRWKICQSVEPDSRGTKADNALILDVLMKGADAIAYRVRGEEGLSDEDFDALMQNVALPCIETNFKTCCGNALKTLKQVAGKVKRDALAADEIQGSINYDPLRRLTLKGAFSSKTGEPFALAKLLVETAETLPKFRVIAVSPYIFHNAGSTIVQELAFGLAMGSEYLSQLTELGLTPDAVASKIKFTFAVSSNYFMEIAKFRAARMLWANIVKTYGATKKCSAKMRIHAVTSAWNQTIYDPYVNLLRGTSEAMSAALAGVDSLEVTAFDAAYAASNEFSGRVARNTQLVLKEESYFDRVTDPAAGAYYIENLTASIAAEAWKLFKQIEEKGGYLAALKEGFVQESIKATAQKRDMNIATRREILLGTNQYPNFTETLDKAVREGSKPSCCCCSAKKEESSRMVEPIDEYRGAKAFEELRMKTENQGKAISVFMLTFGNLAMCRARAQFASNFFACAGFKVIDNNRFATIDEGVAEALKSKAEIVVACSSDDEYATAVPQINEKLGGAAITVVAGDPACKDELTAKGITHFISVRSNVLETLKQYHKELGI
ncbi:MAG: acyl-CoA mutase large subunit family protein [Prevotellaceae bacterium]|jgi:methylmalonyl-CoA mutase|nr:acyl-CoA mutase large subunit family protein [Prevotellaceae bacterium]